MIKLFKDYFDKHGLRYKVMSFDGSKYACQSYRDGTCVYFKVEELFESPQNKPAKMSFPNFVNKRKQTIKERTEIIPEVSSVSEPIYEEPVYEEQNQKKSEVQNAVPLKDNDKETAENDFYADF